MGLLRLHARRWWPKIMRTFLRKQAAACQACFSDIVTYNKCLREDTCSCLRSTSLGANSNVSANHTEADEPKPIETLVNGVGLGLRNNTKQQGFLQQASR